MMQRVVDRFGLRRADAYIALAAIASVAAYVFAAGGDGFPLDDGWIHQTYARNLAEHGEWAFVPGVPSAGSTSPLWTVLLGAGYLLGVNHLLWTYSLGALCLVLAGMLGARVAERLYPGSGLLAGLALVLEWHLVWAGASGMETALFGALALAVMLAAFWSLFQQGKGRAGITGAALGVLGGLLTLTRPEGVGLAALAVMLALATRPFKAWLRWAAGAGAGWFAAVLPGALINLSSSGTVLPNTAAAKQAEYAELLAAPYPERLLDVSAPLLAGVLVALLPGIVWGFVHRWRGGSRGALAAESLPVIWGVALVTLYAARLPVDYQHGRYVIPALPGLIVWGTTGTLAMLRAGRREMWARLLSRTAALTGALVLAVFWGVGLRAYRTDVSIIDAQMVEAARYLADEVPPGDLLAVHDIGAVGYFAPREIIDLAGLVTPEVIDFIRDEGALMAYMQAEGAAYLMTFPAWYPQITQSPQLTMIYPAGGVPEAYGWEWMAIYKIDWNVGP